MKCIICGKVIKTKKDVCTECDKLLDMFYSKNPEDKKMSLELFRNNAKEGNNEKTTK